MFLHVCLVPLSCLVPAEDKRGCLGPWNLSYRCCRLPRGCWDLDLLKEHLCSWPLSQSAELWGHPVITHRVCILAHVMPKQVWPRHQRLEKDLQQARAAWSYFQNNALFEQREILSRKPKHTHTGKYFMAGVIPEQEQLKTFSSKLTVRFKKER